MPAEATAMKKKAGRVDHHCDQRIEGRPTDQMFASARIGMKVCMIVNLEEEGDDGRDGDDEDDE